MRDKAALAALLWRVHTTRGDRLLDRRERSAFEAFRAAGISEKMIDRLLRPFLAGVLLESELSDLQPVSSNSCCAASAAGGRRYPAAGIGAIAATLAAPLADRAAVDPGRARSKAGEVIGRTRNGSARRPSSSPPTLPTASRLLPDLLPPVEDASQRRRCTSLRRHISRPAVTARSASARVR